MRILFLTRRFYPGIGGVEKHVEEVSKILIKKGHDLTVVTKSYGDEGLYKGIKIKRIKKMQDNWFEKFYVWIWFWKNKQLIKNADIVHAHDVFYWYLPFRFMFPRKKVFITFHGYESYPVRKRAIIVRKISELLSNGNICVGDFIKKWYGTKANFVIYGAVNVSAVNKRTINRQSAIFYGRLDDQTGVLDYAKATELIKEKYPKFDFLILGEGKYKHRLKGYNTKKFKKNAVKYLENYNFAFVSRYLSILEALAAKRLAFALYDNPIKEDYLRMSPFSGYIVIENSPKKLAERVDYYLRNRQAEEELIEKGFSWVTNQTWENVVGAYLRLWR